MPLSIDYKLATMRALDRTQLTSRHTVELLILLALPTVLGVIYYLTPSSWQQILVLDHTNPQIHAFWTNALVHEHLPRDAHLLGNIVSYLLVVIPCWILYHYRDEASRFWAGLIIILAFAPFIVSFSSYIAFHEVLGLQIENDRGFSGVVGAIVGFLIMTILQTLAQTQEEKVAVLSMGLYFAYLVTGLGVVTLRLPFIVIGVLLFVITFAATHTEYVAPAEELSEWSEYNRRLSIVLIVAALVSAFVFATSLPADIVTDSNGLKNIVAHGAGIIFGMLVAISLRYTNNRPIPEQATRAEP